MGGGMVRARRRTTGTRDIGGGSGRQEEVNMFDRLASLAQGHGKRTAILALIFFVAAGAIGGGGASKLAPYGADDPATESVKAQDRLEADGFRDPSVIVLLQDVDPNSSAGQSRVRAAARRLG